MGSKRRKKRRNDEPAVQPARRRKWAPIVATLLGLGLVAGVILFSLPGRESEGAKSLAPATPVAATSPAATDKAAMPPDSKPGFERLTGRWQRPDGGYVVEVKSVDEDGKMDASYFNPRRINVAKAEASQDGAATKVFIELRDTNYPGSTYNLIYEPESDRLHGIYYQAALQERFEVVFVRMQ
jgi:uncharacterized protein (DUF2147 family)